MAESIHTMYLFDNHSLKIKQDFFRTDERSFLNWDLFKSSKISFWLWIYLVQMAIVPSCWMLVKSESISSLPIDKLLSCSTISLANEKESLILNSLIVKQFSMGTKKFVILYVGVPTNDNIELKGGKASIFAWWILHRLYQILYLDPPALIFLFPSTVRPPEDFTDFIKIKVQKLFRFSLVLGIFLL